MNITDMTEEVSSKAGIPRATAREAINATLEVIERALRDGQEVKLGSIGKFTVSVSGPREGRSFDGTRLKIPEKRVVRFKPFGGMKEKLNPKVRKRAS